MEYNITTKKIAVKYAYMFKLGGSEIITYMKIFVFVDLLFLVDIIQAMEFKVKALEIGTSGTIPCDHVEKEYEVRIVQWYKSLSMDAFVNGNPSLSSWTDGVTESLKNYHMEDTTLSLVIEKATLEDEGLYKCSVERGDLFTESSYYIRTYMYALPRKDPKITLDTDSNRVYCTVEHVKPLTYPVFNFGWIPDNTETHGIIMNDGTYTASVSCALPHTKNASPVICSFSYLHYQRVGSLDLPDSTTDSPMENKTTTVSPIGKSVTCADDGCNTNHTAIIVEGIVICLLFVAIVILLIMRRVGLQQDQGEQGEMI